MAVVLNTEDNSYFSGGGGGLRRSHSQSQFSLGGTPSSFHTSNTKTNESYSSTPKPQCRSPPSSASSSPRASHTETDISYASTPSSNFSFSDFDDNTLSFVEAEDDVLSFPSYKQDKLYNRSHTSPSDDNLEPPPSPKNDDFYTPSPIDYASPSETPKPDTPEFPEHAEDDTAATVRPSRQVDYLSHDWREEDIWSSWRYIVSRRGEHANSERLENASWRTWIKSKNNLPTIQPETLNWLKEYDVTWLYGPLNPHAPFQKEAHGKKPDCGCSNLDKKPILKKRSMSEVMLQRSLSTASLLKQAAAAVQAQETKGILRPSLSRFHTDYVTYPFSTRRMSHEHSSSAISTDSSGITSPSTGRKHIHFNEQVEQCIAVEIKGEDDDDLDIYRPSYDSDSDDGVVMKRSRSSLSRTRTNAMLLRKRTKKTAPAECAKTIALLPSTTLKYLTDPPPDPLDESAVRHSKSPLISPSSSQETLRPSIRGGRFFNSGDEDAVDGFCDPDDGWRSPPAGVSGSGLKRSTSSSSLADNSGMRRTPSGMLMPLEGVDGIVQPGDGLFGRVVETVNTARDIAHVIWNVGWRK